MAFLMAPDAVFAQASCGGSIGINNTPNSLDLDQIPLGATVRVTLNPAKSNLSGPLTIDHVEYALACADNGDNVPCSFGNDLAPGGGPPIVYLGGVGSEAGNCGATDGSTTDHGDGTVTFNFPPVALDNNGCTITFDVQVNNKGTDSDPLIVTSAADSQGSCPDELQGSARGSASITLSTVPSIDLVKEISVDGGVTWLDANDAATAPVVNWPSGAMYRFRIENTGTADLTNIVVNDPDLGIVDVAVADLPIGASVILDSGDIPELSVAERCDSSGTFENVASVSADSADDESTVGDSDSANLVCVAVDVAIEKSDGGISVAEGASFAYTLSYQNLGDVDVTGVVITETVPVNTTFNAAGPDGGLWNCSGSAAGSTCTHIVGNLAAGAGGSVQFPLTVDDVVQPDPDTGECPVPLPDVVVDNTGNITDDGENGEDVNPGNNEDSDTTPVIVLCEDEQMPPAIDIIKDPPSQLVEQGEQANFHITVTNIGEVPLFNVRVTDAQAPNCNRVIGDMDVGEVFEYDCLRGNVQSSFTNVADVIGEDEDGEEVEDEDDAIVNVIIIDEPEAHIPIPTLSHWALFALAALMLMIGGRQAWKWTRR